MKYKLLVTVRNYFKTFKEVHFYDLKFLLNNDVKVVQFSATPMEILMTYKIGKIIQQRLS